MRQILVVEDNIDLRSLYDRMLRLEGFKPVLASNGREALDLLTTGSIQPEVIILDLMMPVMDGWTFLRERENFDKLKAIPVLVCSAVRDSFPAGYDIVRKPVDMNNLLKLIEKYTDTADQSQSVAMDKN